MSVVDAPVKHTSPRTAFFPPPSGFVVYTYWEPSCTVASLDTQEVSEALGSCVSQAGGAWEAAPAGPTSGPVVRPAAILLHIRVLLAIFLKVLCIFDRGEEREKEEKY